MLELARELAKEFASVTSDRGRNSQRETMTYGVIKKNVDDTYVKLDGTDVLTPISFTMDADAEDRVLVLLKDHSATVIGNVTSPASAKTATSYMKLTGDGLVVGNLGNGGDPTGTYALIAGDGYFIKTQDGKTLASFTSDKIEFGDGKGIFTSDSISLANGALEIDENAVSFQNGRTVFGKDKIVIGAVNGPTAVFTANDISLADGAAKITETSLIFGARGVRGDGPKAVFSVDGITLGTEGLSQARFTTSGISLADGVAVISPSSITLGAKSTSYTGAVTHGPQAVFSVDGITLGTYGLSQAKFTTSGITLADGLSEFTPSSITLGTKGTNSYGYTTYGPKAVFSTDQISLADGAAVITPSSITLGAGGSGSYGPKAVFSTDQISLADGELVITPSSIRLRAKTGTDYYGSAVYGPEAVFSATGMSLTYNGSNTATFTTDGVTLADGEASFSKDSLLLGQDSSTISLCGGNGLITMDNDILVIEGFNARAVGFKNQYFDGVGYDRSEIICRNDGSYHARIGIQTLDFWNNGSSIIVDLSEGITFNALASNATISFNTGSSSDVITANGYEMLQANRLVYAGRVVGTTTIAAGAIANAIAYPDIPDGYRLVGVRQASCSRPKFCVLTRYVADPTTGRIMVTYKNISDSEISVTIAMEWFALRTYAVYSVGESTNVTWGNDE